MPKLTKVRVKWHTDASTELENLGIQSKSEQHTWEPVYIDISKICWVYESGVKNIVCGFSANYDDTFQLDIPFQNFIQSGYDIEKTIKDFYHDN